MLNIPIPSSPRGYAIERFRTPLRLRLRQFGQDLAVALRQLIALVHGQPDSLEKK